MGTSTPEPPLGSLGGWRRLTVSGGADGPEGVPLRPMTVADLLDEPFLLLRAHLRSILLFVAVAVVPSQLVQAYLSRGALSGLDLSEMLADPDGFSAVMGAEGAVGNAGMVVALANTLLLLPLAVGLVSRLAVSSALGERLSDRAVVAATLPRLPALAGTWLLAIAAVLAAPALGVLLAAAGNPLLGASLVTLGLPLTFAAFVLVALAPLLAVVEGRGPLSALRRSAALVRRRFWPSAGALGLALVVSGFVQLALAMIPGTLALILPGDFAWIVASAGSTLAGFVATPYLMLVVVVLYVDALVRLEALDVQRLLEPGLARAG